MASFTGRPWYPAARTWRRRRHQTAGSLLLALYTSSYNSYEAGDKTTNTHKDLHTAKTNLNKAIAEMKKLQQELTEKKVHCQGVSEDLQEALSQLRSPDDQENRDENQLLNNVAEWFAESELDAMNSAMEMAHLASKNTKVIADKRKKPEIEEICATGSLNSSEGATSTNESTTPEHIPKCCICLTSAIDCVLYRCGHTCCCYSCAKGLTNDVNTKKCPVCHSVIRQVIKTYVA